MWYNAVDKINKEAPLNMKRKVTLLTVLLLTLSMLFALTACSSFGSIKKAYEDAGYTESESIQKASPFRNTRIRSLKSWVKRTKIMKISAPYIYLQKPKAWISG